ncbi:MAG: HYR domain-containing protein, partial [Bacteroidota bacterium]
MRLNLLRNSIAIISFIAFTSFTIVPNEGPKSYSSINDTMEPKATPLYAPPTFSGCPPTDVTVNYSPGLCGATVNWTPPVASSDAISVVSNYAPGDSFLPGTTAVIYRATNAIGEVGICAFNVIVEDNEIPVINDCPVDIVVQADPTTCSQVVTWTRPNSVTDNCPAGEGISPVLQDFESTQNQCYVFDQTSISGTGEVNGSRNLRTNFLSSLFPTSFTTPLIYFNGNGEVSFSHNISSVGNNATIFVTMISEGGTRTNIFTEVYSNTVTQTEYIPVTLPAGNYRLEISYSSTAFFDFSQTAFLDDLLIPGTVVTNTNDPSCDRASFIVRRADGTGLNSGDAFPIGVTTIIYDVLDSAKPTENRGVCSFTITVENDIDPPVVVGASPVLYCENDPIPQLEVTVGPGETVDWYTTSTGGIPIIPGGTNTTTYTPTSPGFYYAETRNTSTGCISDTRTEIQVIEVPLPPAPPAPTPIEYCVGDTASQLTATVFPDHTLLWYPVSTGGTSNTTAPTPTTTVADVGSTFFYVSQRSNTTGCESDRTEIEVIVYNLPLAPTVNSPQQFCVGDVASTLDSYVTSGTNLVWYDAAVGGNVIPGTTTPNTASATTAPHQQYWVTQSAINGSANCESTRTRLQVIVNDAPTITSDPTNQAICPGANATFTAAAANAASLQWQLFDGTSWNDLTNTPPHSGVTTTTLTVTNATILLNGNRYRIIASSAAVSCSDAISSEAVLTVEDNSNPVITGCPAGPITASSGPGNCGAAVTWTPPSVNDDCGTATLTTNNYNPGDTFLPGTTTVIYTATDLAGNTATCSFDVIVTDDEDPVISGPSDITVPADNVGCTAIVNYAAPTATDNCAAGDGTFPVFTDFEVANRNVLANDCWVFAGTDVSTSSPLSGATSMRTSEV